MQTKSYKLYRRVLFFLVNFVALRIIQSSSVVVCKFTHCIVVYNRRHFGYLCINIDCSVAQVYF
jgi:hypothetical protein